MPKGSQDGSIYQEKIRNSSGEIVSLTWRVRVRYTDARGRQREMKRTPSPNNYARACELRRKLLAAREAQRAQAMDVERLRFSDLAQFYREHYAVAARYVDGRKVEGLRSLATVKTNLRVLEAHFGGCKLQGITYEDLRLFKAQRLRTVTRMGRGRSIATVNRELMLLRRLLSVAVRNRWIGESPFRHGEGLISMAQERERMRALTQTEEARLLAACGESVRAGLRAAVICALDTGLRANEQHTLRRADVDLETGIITVRAFNAKTSQERVVPVTGRLRVELLSIFRHLQRTGDPLVFPVRYKGAFKTALAAAGIEDFRWHDLRHTAITWMLGAGIQAAEVMKISGHTQWKTFLRYVNTNEETARAAAERMDARRAELAAQEGGGARATQTAING